MFFQRDIMSYSKFVGAIFYPLTAWWTKQIFIGIRPVSNFDIIIGLKREGQPAMIITLQQFSALEAHWNDITDYLVNENGELSTIQLDQHLQVVSRECFGSRGLWIEDTSSSEVFIFTKRSWDELNKLRECLHFNIREKVNARTRLLFCVGEAKSYVNNRPQNVAHDKCVSEFPHVFLSKPNFCRETQEFLTYFYPSCTSWIFEQDIPTA